MVSTTLTIGRSIADRHCRRLPALGAAAAPGGPTKVPLGTEPSEHCREEESGLTLGDGFALLGCERGPPGPLSWASSVPTSDGGVPWGFSIFHQPETSSEVLCPAREVEPPAVDEKQHQQWQADKQPIAKQPAAFGPAPGLQPTLGNRARRMAPTFSSAGVAPPSVPPSPLQDQCYCDDASGMFTGDSSAWWSPMDAWTADALSQVGLTQLQQGTPVRFQGLQKTVELNGECGVVDRWDSALGRWIVVLHSGEEKFARTENLEVVEPAMSACHYPLYPDYAAKVPYAALSFPSAWPAQGSLSSAEAPRVGCGTAQGTWAGPPGKVRGSSGVASGYGSESTATGTARSKESSFASDDGQLPALPLTTVMMRNIPTDFTRKMLVELLDSQGFNGTYDLVYLPIDYQSSVGFGYGFVNLVTNNEAETFRTHFEGFTQWGVESEKVCEVCWSNVLQGLQAHIDRYRNSPVMHDAVPDEFKPAMFAGGTRVPFPSPTKTIRKPRTRRKDGAIAQEEGDSAIP